MPSGIAAVTDFLDHNPEFAVAQGHYLTFIPGPGGKVRFEPRYIRHFLSRVTGDTAVERLADRSPQYASFLYGVVRSDVFKQMYTFCFDSSGELRFRNLFLAEDFFCNAVRMYGGYATVPCFFSARERIPGSATNTTVPKSVVMSDPAYKAEYDGYVTALTEALLANEPEMTLADAESLINRIDSAPLDAQSVEFKRRVVNFCARHRLLSPLSRLLDYRYRAKGLRAVKGMVSYPCRETTPEIQAILKAIRSTKTAERI